MAGTPDFRRNSLALAPLLSHDHGKAPASRHVVRKPDPQTGAGRRIESQPAGTSQRYVLTHFHPGQARTVLPQVSIRRIFRGTAEQGRAQGVTLGEQHLTSAVAGSIKREWSAGRLGCGREAVSATSGRLACEPGPQTLPGSESGQIAVSVVRFPDSGDERRSMVCLVRVGRRAGHVQLRPREAAPPPAAQHGPDSAGQA